MNQTPQAFCGLEGDYDEALFEKRYRPYLSGSPVKLFTEGACHVFAVALHRHFDYPLSFFRKDTQGGISHVFCRFPPEDVYAVDAWGFSRFRDREWELGNLPIASISLDDLVGHFCTKGESALFGHKVFWEPAYAIAEERIWNLRQFFDGTACQRTPDAFVLKVPD